ncbi:MAG: response regulator [Peptococcaceae bacterium]|nr:response regulator [Peptococcaceae bacterium]
MGICLLAEKKKILVVDDIELNRMILSDLFCDEFDVLEAENGQKALDLLYRYQDQIAIVLLDLVMPVLDGFGVLHDMQESKIIQSIPVIMITGENDDEKSLKGFELGVSDLLNKPFNSKIVYRRVINVVELYAHKQNLEEKLAEQKEMLEKQAERLHQSNQFVIDALSTTVEFRSCESGEHIKNIRGLTKILLEAVKDYYPDVYPITKVEIGIIESASAMHDIGKIAIPDAILLKPGSLTSEEFEIMKTHAIRGCEILSTLNYTQDQEYYKYCYEICRHHHERWDGRGYPDGLIGDEISIWAQATSLADVYDALTSKRVYKPAFTHEQAADMIMEGECGAFNPILLDCFDRSRAILFDAKKLSDDELRKEA